MVQGLRLHASIAGGMGSIPSQGTKILHAPDGTAKIKEVMNNFNKPKQDET